MLQIDTHAHVLPREWPNLAEKYVDPRFTVSHHTDDDGYPIDQDSDFCREIRLTTWDVPLRIGEYAQHGVQMQLVSTVAVMFSCWAKPNQALKLHQPLSDLTAEICRRQPQQYAGIATVTLQSPTLVIQELECSIEQLGLQGVHIGSCINAWNLDVVAWSPFIETGANLGAAVPVHSWDMLGRKSMPKYWLPWLVDMPAEQSRAACCLLFDSVLERLPNLRVCLAHDGGSFLYAIGCIEHGSLRRPDLLATETAPNPREHFERLFSDSCAHDAWALRYLIEVAGAEHVMPSTDHPFRLGEQKPGSGIAKPDLPPPRQPQLRHARALPWLGLPASRFQCAA
jgi:aminocarboxymuconate-semialdehyde decarboxylase